MPTGSLTADFTMDALGRELQRVSDEIKREVGALLPAAATEMVGRLEARYPVGRRSPRASNREVPHMRDTIRVRSLVTNDPLLPGKRVVGPNLGYIWQDGTIERSYLTQQNVVTHRTGRGSPQDPKFFERTAVQVRSAMLDRARAILERPREL